MEEGHYLRRVFDPVRDGVIGYWEVSDQRAEEIMLQMMKFRLAYQETMEEDALAILDTRTRAGPG